MASKYIGKIYDGRWKVVSIEKYKDKPKCRGRKFVLENIFNKRKMTLKESTLKKIDEGEKTVSDVMSYKLKSGRFYKGVKNDFSSFFNKRW